jgi:RNA polymerase sigma-70 factor (ECF subfamily)
MDGQGFSSRMQAMSEVLYRVCASQLSNPSDREEAVQECVSKAWEKLATLNDERYFQTWIIRILINVCHDIQRRNTRSVPMEEKELSAHGSEKSAFQDDGVDELRELRAAILGLKEELRLPLVLRYACGFSTREIARMLGLQNGTVRTRLSRARAHLRAALRQNTLSSAHPALAMGAQASAMPTVSESEKPAFGKLR